MKPSLRSPDVRNEHDSIEKKRGTATGTGNLAGSEPSGTLIATAYGLTDSLLAAARSADEKPSPDTEFRGLEGVPSPSMTVSEWGRGGVVSDLSQDRLRERKLESTPGQGHNQPVGIPLAMIRSLSNNTTSNSSGGGANSRDSSTIDNPNEGGLGGNE